MKAILRKIYPRVDFRLLDRVWADTVAFFEGRYPGYRKCTTEYHDLKHTTDALLATARLIDGVRIAGGKFEDDDAILALVSALLHDVGYIQQEWDAEGTGGKYTLVHVERSIAFMHSYFAEHALPGEKAELVESMIRCTGIAEEVAAIPFPSTDTALLGRITGTADFTGQIADRIYLEKLLFLYREFHEAGIPGYGCEMDLLKKTAGFYRMMRRRLEQELGNLMPYFVNHFKTRWGVDRNLYVECMENNLAYLQEITRDHGDDYRGKLKRGGVVNRLCREERYVFSPLAGHS